MAAYASDDSDTPDIFYGDVTTNLKKSVENVDLPVSRLGSGTQKMTEVQGRFLTSSTSGPTGTLNMIYRPAGKPAMIVDQKPIVAGWFETSVFESLPMDYKTDTGVVIGEQWTDANLITSPASIRVYIPSGFAQMYSGYNSFGYEPREARQKVFGFFAASPSLTADKKICVTSQLKNGGTIHDTQVLETENIFTARAIKHYAYNLTPTILPQQVTIAGGIARENCGALYENEEFKYYMWLFAGNGHQTGSDLNQMLGLAHGFTAYMRNTNTDQLNRYMDSLQFSNVYGLHARYAVLPGFESYVDGVQIFQGTGGNYDDRCDKLDSARWSLYKTLPAVFIGNELVIRTADVNPSTNNGLCLLHNGKVFGRMSYMYYSVPAPATTAAFAFRKQPNVNECAVLSVSVQGSGFSYIPAESATMTVHTKQSSSDFPILYDNSQCAGSPTAHLDLTFARGENSKTYFIKHNAAVSFDMTLTSSYAGISMPASMGMSVVPASSNPIERFAIQSNFYLDPGEIPSMSVYPYGCFPLRVQATDTSGYPIGLNGTVTITTKDLAGNNITKPAGFDFYDTCASSTPISSVSFAAEDVKPFVIKTGATIPQDLRVQISGFAKSYSTSINVVRRADRLAWDYSGSPGIFTTTTGTCTAMVLKTQDGSGNPKAVDADVYVSLSAIGGAPEDMQVFQDSSCGTGIVTGVINQGTSQKTFYVRASKARTNNYLRAFSEQAPSFAEANITTTPGAMTIIGPTGAVPNQTLDFLINGGSAPFTAGAYDAARINAPPSIYWDSPTNRYHVQLQVSSSPPTGTANFTITDSSGQTMSPSFSVTP